MRRRGSLVSPHRDLVQAIVEPVARSCWCRRWPGSTAPASAACTWPTLAASVALTPAETFSSRRVLPAEPKDTLFGSVATEPAPMATALVAPAATVAPAPMAVPPAAATVAPAPTAVPWLAVTLAW